MSSNKLKTFFTAAAIIAALSLSAEAQSLRASASAIKPKAASPAKRTYEPVVLGRSQSFVIEGRVDSARNGRIEIRTARGARHQFEADDQTIYLQSDELVSISTLPDVSLTLSDLRASDRVEIVADREGQRIVARIVTRIGRKGQGR